MIIWLDNEGTASTNDGANASATYAMNNLVSLWYIWGGVVPISTTHGEDGGGGGVLRFR